LEPCEAADSHYSLDSSLIAKEIRNWGRIQEKCLPLKVNSPTVLSRSLDFIEMAWQKSDSPETPITSYVLEMATDDGNFKRVYRGLNLSHKVLNLMPSSKYQFRVYATNEFGMGKPSDSVSFSTDTASIQMLPAAITDYSGCHSHHVATNLLDTTPSYWASPDGDFVNNGREPIHWIVFDLGNLRTITEIRLKHRGDAQAPKTLILLFSNNPTGNFTQALSLATQLSPNPQAFGPFKSLRARYWKLVITGNHGARSGSFYILNYVQFIGLPV